jgi:hypothetical protein
MNRECAEGRSPGVYLEPTEGPGLRGLVERVLQNPASRPLWEISAEVRVSG